MVTDSSNAYYNNPAACASQYYPATQSDFSTWDLTTQWYAQNMGNAVATTHFVVDTSRNGDGPDNMQQYASAPYDQPASIISTLAAGNWCNPPGSGLGLRPTARTGVPLLNAWRVKPRPVWPNSMISRTDRGARDGDARMSTARAAAAEADSPLAQHLTSRSRARVIPDLE